jgi:hypothetical protein
MARGTRDQYQSIRRCYCNYSERLTNYKQPAQGMDTGCPCVTYVTVRFGEIVLAPAVVVASSRVASVIL